MNASDFEQPEARATRFDRIKYFADSLKAGHTVLLPYRLRPFYNREQTVGLLDLLRPIALRYGARIEISNYPDV